MNRNIDPKLRVPRFNEANGFHTTKARSKIMSRIRSTNTKSEVLLRTALWALGIRYRKNDSRLPGKPDIAIYKSRIVIFIDGEFWHGYDWPANKKCIKSNAAFWIAKIESNMQRDETNNRILEELGWTVIRIWERQIKKEFGACLKSVLDSIALKEDEFRDLLLRQY